MSELRRRVPSQNLRGVDALMLEVLASDLVEKPLGQLAPENVADLFAMMDLATAPGSIRKRAVNFRQRIAVEIADIPNGADYEVLVAEWRAVPAARVPETLRQIWRDERARPKRSFRERALVDDLLASWEGVESEPFVIAPPKPAPVKRAPAAAPSVKPPPRARQPAAPRPAARVITPGRPDDAQRSAWVKEVCYERLASALDSGLLEAVLVAGVRHRAREHYPHLSNADVIAVLQEMSRLGQAKVSAGRWQLAGLRGR